MSAAGRSLLVLDSLGCCAEHPGQKQLGESQSIAVEKSGAYWSRDIYGPEQRETMAPVCSFFHSSGSSPRSGATHIWEVSSTSMNDADGPGQTCPWDTLI